MHPNAQPIGPTSLDLPAWVQAIGSILAILVSVAIVYYDGRRRRVERIDSEASFAIFIVNMLHITTAELTQLASWCRGFIANVDPNDPQLDQRARMVHDHYQMLVVDRMSRIAELPMTAWPDPVFALSFYEEFSVGQKMLNDLGDRLREAEEGNDWDGYEAVRDMARSLDRLALWFEHEFVGTHSSAQRFISEAERYRRREVLKRRDIDIEREIGKHDDFFAT
jgi:hypothetical protein